uniref:Protein ANTAGONIST OF LIKE HETEROCHROMATIN PROTEIN 1 n=1 Tax=Kryptolebias marmoratus TaxID=37003 RepID=A0A3Q3B3H0_KRYMA
MLDLQAVLLNRNRARELLERDRRRRQYLRRRRAFLLSSITAILSLVTTTQRPVWVRNRSQNFWGMTEQFDDDEWKAQFRVSRATFDYVLKLIGLRIKRRRRNYLVPIEPRCRLAMTLWWFARSEEYRSIANLFGVGIATVCTIVRQVISAIVDRLYRRFVSLPSGQRLDDTIRAFRDRCYPQCAGAIGGTHIPISAPRDNPEHYMNRRGWYSVILQAVVDHNHCFTDVYAGWPGSSSSAAVLSSSDLFLKAEDRPDSYLFPKELSPEQRRFTFTLASAHSVVDTAFVRLKGRWRCLLKKSDMNVSMMPRVVAACCVLHNICERRGDAFLPEWSVEMAPHGMYLIQPAVEPYEGHVREKPLLEVKQKELKA